LWSALLVSDAGPPDDYEPGMGGEDAGAGARCPFLGESMAESTLICLADAEPVAVSRRYGDSYCLTPHHTTCSLYIAAVTGERMAPPGVFAPIEVALQPPRAAHQGEAASPASLQDTSGYDTTVVETRLAALAEAADPDQAAALALELGALVQNLSKELAASKASNESMTRRLRILQEMAENPDFLRHVVRMPPDGEPMDPSDLSAIQQTLQALLRNPQDLPGLVRLATQSTKLEHIVGACAYVASVLEE
jgi:hypothetical protein